MENLTVKQWLTFLPKPIRLQAETNIGNFHIEALNIHTASLSLALKIAFPWQQSNEGFDYWYQVYTDYKTHNINHDKPRT